MSKKLVQSIKVSISLYKPELDTLRKHLGILESECSDEGLAEALVQELIDRYFSPEYFNPEETRENLDSAGYLTREIS